MSNIMNSLKVKNKPSRNGFDMSEQIAFTAKVGALLPIKHMHLSPGDKIDDNIKFFSRTAPMRSAAFGRVRETFDFFFVPYRVLWDEAQAFFTSMDYNYNSNNNVSQHIPQQFVPSFTVKSAYSVISNILKSSQDNVPEISQSFGGNWRGQDMMRLLDYLGYGKIVDYDLSSSTIEQVKRDNISLNWLPLSAYHKIYYDFYRNKQWENDQPHMYYHKMSINGSPNPEVPTGDYINNPHVFDLHYCNYERDKYLGVLPHSQFGDPSIVFTANQDITNLNASTASLTAVGITPSTLNSNENINNAFNFNILALRQASALQKWKEIAQFASTDYRAQVKAHWGIDVSDARSNLVTYLGGCTSVVDINSQVNQNLASGNEANVQGNGNNVGKQHISFTAPEHGIFMCIYHASPLVDYNGDFTMLPECRKVYPTDFPIPEFDSIGMEVVLPHDVDLRSNQFGSNSILGYAPRYIDFKSRVDRTLGDFNNTRKDWVIPLPLRVTQNFRWTTDDHLGYQVQNYCRFKVSPDALDSIFFLSVNSDNNGYASDQFLVDVSFDCKKVSNLNYSGMPY